MASHGILECFGSEGKAFSAVVLADGMGSPRVGAFRGYTDEMMREVRIKEQKAAADMGKYASVVMLGYPSAQVRKPADSKLADELCRIVRAMRPKVVYIHNPADKHQTHVGAALRAIEALKLLEPCERPEKLYGCEVWRSLDWMNDDEKIILDLSGREELREEILKVYKSQIAGGKRYDLAALGRERANATFLASHKVDCMDAASYAIDLTPVLSWTKRFAVCGVLILTDSKKTSKR